MPYMAHELQSYPCPRIPIFVVVRCFRKGREDDTVNLVRERETLLAVVVFTMLITSTYIPVCH